MNIDEDVEGFENFGILSKNNFDKINIYSDKNTKYFSFNNEINKISKTYIEQLKANELNKSKKKI